LGFSPSKVGKFILCNLSNGILESELNLAESTGVDSIGTGIRDMEGGVGIIPLTGSWVYTRPYPQFRWSLAERCPIGPSVMTLADGCTDVDSVCRTPGEDELEALTSWSKKLFKLDSSNH
jgi:hypothetical protein